MGDILLVEGSNELNVPMVPEAAEAMIISSTWQVEDIEGNLGGLFVRGSITISSRGPFRGKITVAIPPGYGMLGEFPVSEPHVVIAANDIINSEDYNTLIAYNQLKLAECTDETCRQHYQLILERLGYLTHYDGFYEYYMNPYNPEERIENHIEKIGVGVASKTYELDIPTGEFAFPVGFFLRADETHYSEEWTRIRYDAGSYSYSPEISLYEGETVLDNKVAEGAIAFTLAPTGAQPVGASFPSTVGVGEKFWAEQAAYLPLVADGRYRLELKVKLGTNVAIISRGAFAAPDRLKCYGYRCHLMPESGIYTARGYDCPWDSAEETYDGCPIKRMAVAYWHTNWWKWINFPSGIYTVFSECSLLRETSSCSTISFKTLWKDVAVGEIEIV